MVEKSPGILFQTVWVITLGKE